MTIERIKIFFISDVNCGVDQFGEENRRPRASQMKPARKPKAALCVLREFFRRLKTCFNSAKRCYLATETEKAFAAGERLSKLASVCLAHKATLNRRFTVCSRPLAAQVCSLRAAHSPSGFARPALSTGRPWSAFRSSVD